MKKILSMLLALSMLLTSLFICTSCLGGDGSGDGSGTGGSGVGEASSFVSLDINPEIILTVDENNLVVTVTGENEDALVLLYGEDTLVGKDAEVAVDKIISLAVELGYLTEDNKAVELIVDNANSEKATELLGKLKSKITATSESTGLSLTVGTEGAYSLLREYEAFKAANPSFAEISLSKYKMALTASEDGELTLDAALALDDSALIKNISQAKAEVEAYYTDAYKERHDEAMRVYNYALDAELDLVYAEYFSQNGQMSAGMFYSYIYQIYALTARGLYAAADTIEFFDTTKNYELDETRVNAILESLGLSATETDKLKNEDGKITLDSVLDYADIYMKNLDTGVDKAAIKAAPDSAIANAEIDVKAEADRLAREYAPQLESLITSSEAIKQVMETASLLAPANLKTEITTMLADYEAAAALLRELLEGGTPTAEALSEVADGLDKKAKQILVKIEGLLDADAKADIEARKKSKRDAKASEREAFEETIASARRDAEERLNNLKNSRKNKQ